MTEAKRDVSQNLSNGQMHRIHLPEGANSVIELVRQGMQLYPSSAESAAKAVGLNTQVYRLTRKLLLLRSRQVLNLEEEEIAKKALFLLDVDRRIYPAQKLAEPLLEKYWAPKTPDGAYKAQNAPQRRQSVRERRAFERTLFAIREACTNNAELNIPAFLSRPEKEDARNTIYESIGHLTLLAQRIMGDKT